MILVCQQQKTLGPTLKSLFCSDHPQRGKERSSLNRLPLDPHFQLSMCNGTKLKLTRSEVAGVSYRVQAYPDPLPTHGENFRLDCNPTRSVMKPQVQFVDEGTVTNAAKLGQANQTKHGQWPTSLSAAPGDCTQHMHYESQALYTCSGPDSNCSVQL